MNRKIIGILLCMLLIATASLPVVVTSEFGNNEEENAFPISHCGCFSSSCDCTISYSVTGPDDDGNYEIHYKVTNNGDTNEINRIEVGHGPESTGSDTASAPHGWSTSGTKPENGDVGGMFFESSDQTAIGPGQTQTGFSWTVNSPNGEPTSNSALVWCRPPGGGDSKLTYVQPKKDEAQTESKNCEDPEEHGFGRESSSELNGFEVIPDEYIHNENCVIAVGDIIETSDSEYFAELTSPIVDMSWHPTPEVQFTHIYNGWYGCSGTLWGKTSSEGSWIKLLSFGEDCNQGEICHEEGRVILPILEIGATSAAELKWEFSYTPSPENIPPDEKAYWVLDDLLIVSELTTITNEIIYVDDDNIDGPWDGSVEYPYRHIQNAIDNANIYDAIFVSEGIYYENIIIDKTLNIVGEGATKTHCNGGIYQDVVIINADRVFLTGFTIQNSGSNEEDAAINIYSNYNTICDNIIEDNSATGIYLHDSANYNRIFGNTIRNNDGAGIFIWEASDNNYIFHNNFINNGWYNAKDKCNNYWDNSYPSGGNYWDDYNGVDGNSDGIGDIPYDILGDGIGTNMDRYPYMNLNGWNVEPNRPIIYGTANGKAGEEYEYLFTAMDPNGDRLYFEIDWGDESENEITKICDGIEYMDHLWAQEGTYIISTRAIDTYGTYGDWATLEVSMPKNKPYINTPFARFLESHPNMFPLLRQLLEL